MAFINGTSNWFSYRFRNNFGAQSHQRCPRHRFYAKVDPDELHEERYPAGIPNTPGPSKAMIPQTPANTSTPTSVISENFQGGNVRRKEGDLTKDTAAEDEVEEDIPVAIEEGEDTLQTVQRESVAEAEACSGNIVFSPTLKQYYESQEEDFIDEIVNDGRTEWLAAWALAVSGQKGYELRNQYSRVGILIAYNFPDFEPAKGCLEAYKNASLEEISLTKAKMVYEATGLPAIAESNEFTIAPPKSGTNINKTLQQGYFTRFVEMEADEMVQRVRPISDENRMTTFKSVVAYYDGENELFRQQLVHVAIVFSGKQYATIATSAALDELYKELTRRFGLKLDGSEQTSVEAETEGEAEKGKKLVGATLLRERILRDGKILGDGIIKVSSFMNHMVDTDLMEECGEELAERLRGTMPNKVLTVESTGLIVGLPTARKLGIPLVFARKSRPITISDSYQTTYRSATKGTTSDLIVSCEYLDPGDRVLIIDDFLAGGSTAEALFKLAKMAHAKVVGVGVLIEKMSEGGRTFLSGYDVPVESLAKILPGSEKGRIKIVEEEPWVSLHVGKRGESGTKGKMPDPKAKLLGMTSTSVALDDEDEDEDEGEGVDVINWDDDEDDL